MAALNIWLGGLVERQGREELDLAARRHMTLSEAPHRARGGGARRAGGPRRRFLPRRQRGRAASDHLRSHPGQRTFDRRARWPHAVHRRRQPAGAAQSHFVRAAVGRQPQSAGTGAARRATGAMASHPPSRAQARAMVSRRSFPPTLFVPQVSPAGRAAEISCPHADRRWRGDRRVRRVRPPADDTMFVVTDLPSGRYATPCDRYRHRRRALPPTRAICAHWAPSPAGFLRSLFLRFRC